MVVGPSEARQEQRTQGVTKVRQMISHQSKSLEQENDSQAGAMLRCSALSYRLLRSSEGILGGWSLTEHKKARGVVELAVGDW